MTLNGQRDQARRPRAGYELEELRQDRDRERDRGNGIRRGPEPRIRVLASDVDSWSRALGMQSSENLIGNTYVRRDIYI